MDQFPKDNHPDVWRHLLPRPIITGHKYDRGHAVIYGAPQLTGATRLAAEACSRIGAGLVTVLAGENADLYKTTLPADIMVHSGRHTGLRSVTAVLAGSGGIADDDLKAISTDTVGPVRVLDADAIKDSGELSRFGEGLVLTPHDGEFSRCFSIDSGNRALEAQSASRELNAIIVRKGAETIIAHPDGRTIANRHSDPYLAKAGTGDVLAGMITGLIAQKMPTYEACCAAVWMHGEAGIRIGAGLVAADIAGQIPAILKKLLS